MSTTLGAQTPITPANEHRFTPEGLPKDLQLFFRVHPEDFKEKTLRYKHAFYLLLILAAAALIREPAFLPQVAEMLGQTAPKISDLMLRIWAGVLIAILLLARFLADTSVRKSLKTWGSITDRVLYHRLTQGRYEEAELIQLFQNRQFDKLFGLETDEDSNIYLTIKEDKKGKVAYIFLGAYDNYVPLPLAPVEIIAGEEYQKLNSKMPKD